MVRTRFAPSPTGYLHIGGVRTALFNWLFARHHGGRFILRIDDTDVRRNLDEALQPILDGFRWLGIDWNEGPDVGGDFGPYFQSQRLDRYQAAVKTLLEKGLAYRDFARPEEIQAEREAAQREKRPFVYSRRWMAQSPEQQREFEAEGRSGVVRLNMPREGQCTFDDHIRGPMTVQWSGEQDHVVQRADGTCLYHLASVVDDHDMQITHVIRAEEHLSNTPRQIFIAQGLGYELPEYAHVPFVAEPGSKNKLSKRKLDKYLKNPDFAKLNEHGKRIADRIGLETAADTFNPVIVDFYRQVGFLPDALVNYLLLLGWSLDDKTEFFTREEMKQHFSLERVNKSPASFDPGKLVAFQDRYMQQLPIKQKVALVLPFLQKAGLVPAPPPCEVSDRLHAILEAAGDRIKVAGDILDYADLFMPDEMLDYDEKAFEKRLVKPTRAGELLSKLVDRLRDAEPLVAIDLESLVKQFAAEENAKLAEVVHPLRIALTGKPVGFGLYETMKILDRDQGRCRKRILLALEKAKDQVEGH